MKAQNEIKKVTDYDKIRERLHWYIDSKARVTINRFAAEAGVDPSGFAASLRGKRTLSDKTIRIVCSTWGISEEWLRTGNGEPDAQREEKSIAPDLSADMPFVVEVYENMGREGRGQKRMTYGTGKMIEEVLAKTQRSMFERINDLTKQNAELMERIAGLEKSQNLLLSILSETQGKKKKQA